MGGWEGKCVGTNVPQVACSRVKTAMTAQETRLAHAHGSDQLPGLKDA